MGKQIRAYYIDPSTNTAEPRVIDADLQTYYRLLHCDCIDIVTRKIGTNRSSRVFDIICDDEGLLQDDPLISAIDNLGRGMLVGALLITGTADAKGDLTDLTEKDVQFIRKRIVHLGTRRHPSGWNMLTQCEYA